MVICCEEDSAALMFLVLTSACNPTKNGLKALSSPSIRILVSFSNQIFTPLQKLNRFRTSAKHMMMSIHCMIVHIDSPSVTTYLLCRPLLPNLESRYTIHIAIPFMDNSLFVRFNLFKFMMKNHHPYPIDLHHHATVGHYR
jgi:hypothetical protein